MAGMGNTDYDPHRHAPTKRGTTSHHHHHQQQQQQPPPPPRRPPPAIFRIPS
jgi:hypothetical protein